MEFKVKTLSTLTLVQVAKNLYFLQMQYSIAKSKTASAVQNTSVCVCRTRLMCRNFLAVTAAAINWQLVSRAELVNESICS